MVVWGFTPDEQRRALGERGERLARRFLAAQGYVIRETNVRFPVGEIDVVAQEGGVLCFVEIRSASSTQWGGALSSITDRKRQRLIRAAQWYLARLREPPPEIRFDVVAIEWGTGASHTVELIRSAFDAS